MCNVIHNFIFKFNNTHTNERSKECHFPSGEYDGFI